MSFLFEHARILGQSYILQHQLLRAKLVLTAGIARTNRGPITILPLVTNE